MVSDFSDKMGKIRAEIGFGTLRGDVVVDQIYAHYQHQGLSMQGRPLVYHRGGGAFFLTRPLLDNYRDYYERCAKAIREGENLVHAMATNAEHLSDEVATHAPVEFTNLRASGHPSVTDDGATVYDRPPIQHRLTDAELSALSKLRGGHPYGNRGRRLR